MARLRSLVDSGGTGAAIAWVLVAAVAVATLASAVAVDPAWTAYGLAVVTVAAVPAVRTGDLTVVLSWPALALAALPVLARWAGLFGAAVGYLGVAALALLVAVEVEAFSGTEMPPWFAVLFVVQTTLAVAALWGVVQYGSDVAFGTSYLAGRTDLMWDLVTATAVGIGAGVLFEVFFRGERALAAAGEAIEA